MKYAIFIETDSGPKFHGVFNNLSDTDKELRYLRQSLGVRCSVFFKMGK